MDGHRRSARSRKKVNYSKFSESSDDDFEEKNASVTKKKKRESREKNTSETSRKKPEKKEAKNTSNDVQSRPLGSEKPVLHKDVKVSLKNCQEDKKPNDESENDATKEDEDKEQKEDVCKTKSSNRTVKGASKSEVDIEKDANYTVSDEEEDDDDQEDWQESSDESKSSKRKSNKTPQSKARKEEKAVLNHSKSATRQAKRQDSQNHSTPKGKVTNYCSKQPLNLPAVKLRLGLSRKAVTKPLHSAVKVQQ